MPVYPHIDRYYGELSQLIEFGGLANEENIRSAFQNCLAAYCAEQSEQLVLVPELRSDSSNKPDGTIRDSLRMTRGLWEAKDTHDDLDREIRNKLSQGYSGDNILFEDSRTAVLIQNNQETRRTEMTDPAALHELIRKFLDYELPEIKEFREARQQFQMDLPTVLERLRETIVQAECGNRGYQEAARVFLELCHQSISPEVSNDDVREMLIQHILTKDIFLRVFYEDQFHRENNVARQLDALERTFFTGDVRHQAIDRLRAYYGAIGRAAVDIAGYGEKQQFIKGVYEDFYQAYNPGAADRLGVVYTPNEVVDFIIRGTDWLLHKHFGRTLSDDNVNILDPATGTGTFITNLISHLPADRLEYKYLNEIHANEVEILPYYIANLNIEYTYKELTGRYLEFPNLCFVDTLDNIDWRGASGAVVQRQTAMNLGGVSEENWIRVQEQNEKSISVIIGNPPYNATQRYWNDFNPNRAYPVIDQRIRETYAQASGAQNLHKQYDMYKRFVRWASDRLADDGIIGFVSNSGFLDGHQDDGFRKVLAEEFNELWVIDLKGNARTSGERRRQEGGNIFSNKIRVGVAVYFLVRRGGLNGFKVYYNAVGDYAKAADKVDYLKDQSLADFAFTDVTPDGKAYWLDQSDSDFETLVAIADREGTPPGTAAHTQAVFALYSLGNATNRDEWAYDFAVLEEQHKAAFFAETYNGFLDAGDESYNPVIKWSRNLRRHFESGQRIEFAKDKVIAAHYRPFVLKWYFADPIMSNDLTRKHYEIFGSDLQQSNAVISFSGPASSKPFQALATSKLFGIDTLEKTQCVPLYRYTADGERVSNITEWGLRQFREHYSDEGISAEDIFAYTYAMLQDPAYRERYEVDLRRDFPRVYFQDDFAWWAQQGRALLDSHLGFETAEPWPLERQDKDGVTPARAILRADKERNVITVDEQTSLAGVPAEAWDYRLGSRSALEWVLDQYKERKPRDPTIRERFNTYRFADHKERVVDLLGRVCAVSAFTTNIVNELNLRSTIEQD